MTPTFDRGRYRFRLKLLERKVDKFSTLENTYFV